MVLVQYLNKINVCVVKYKSSSSTSCNESEKKMAWKSQECMRLTGNIGIKQTVKKTKGEENHKCWKLFREIRLEGN